MLQNTFKVYLARKVSSIIVQWFMFIFHIKWVCLSPFIPVTCFLTTHPPRDCQVSPPTPVNCITHALETSGLLVADIEVKSGFFLSTAIALHNHLFECLSLPAFNFTLIYVLPVLNSDTWALIRFIQVSFESFAAFIQGEASLLAHLAPLGQERSERRPGVLFYPGEI